MDREISISFNYLSKIAQKFGLNLVALSPINNADSQRAYLQAWQEAGNMGDMEYMKRDADIFCEPKNLLPELKSIVLFSVNYSYRKLRPLKTGYARVARYAWGKDYHKVLKKRLKLLINEIQEHLDNDISYRIFTDAVPFLERFYAQQAGLGFIGKNSMLIKPGEGSYSFIGEILWDIEVAEAEALEIISSCGSCTRCSQACPTNAIVNDFEIDARKCISYLTIEKRGELNQWETNALGEWIFGCDLCQEICPFNHKSLKLELAPALPEFEDLVVKDGQISLEEILSIKDDQEFKKRFQGSPILRTKRQGLIRNACAVSVNTRATELIPLIKECLKDNDEIIQTQAQYALSQLEN